MAEVVAVLSGMRSGGVVAGSISDGSGAAWTSWEFFILTLPPSVPYAPLPVSLSLHIL